MTRLKCTRCGNTLAVYGLGISRYQSPVKKCRKCGAIYADPRCHELAVEGIPADCFRMTGGVAFGIFGAFLLYRGIYLLPYHLAGVPASIKWYAPHLLIAFGAACLAVGLLEVIAIKSGWKRRIFNRRSAESEQRLRDKEYAYLLKKLGYPVPEQYL